MQKPIPLILASQSPRRAELLREAGVDFEQRSPPYADPDQPPKYLRGEQAEQYAASLAQRKAQSLLDELTRPAWVLAADTICVDDQGQLVGKPIDRADAERMIRLFMNTTHRVITGVTLLGPGDQSGETFSDTATVRMGAIADDRLAVYIDTDGWRGKAGAYNLFDRQADGWPIRVTGDPTTVVGLPMRRLMPMLTASLHSHE